MQRKIHNKTLFVAALSVYLGLLIAGAPPQILAQQSGFKEVLAKTSIDTHKIASIKELEERYKQGKKEHRAFISQLRRLLVEEPSGSSATNFSVKEIYTDGVATDLQILNAAGNLSVIDFLRQEFTKTSQLPPFLQPEYQSVFHSFEISQTEFVRKTVVTFTNEDSAKRGGSILSMVAQNALRVEFRRYEQNELEGKKAELNPFVAGLTVNFAKNQVFTVTRLPRAALISFSEEADEETDESGLFSKEVYQT